MKCAIFLTVCFLLFISFTQHAAADEHNRHRQHDLSRYIYGQHEQHTARQVRQAQEHKYEFGQDRSDRQAQGYKHEFGHDRPIRQAQDYKYEFDNARPVRQAQDYKYDFEAYNDVHPPNEREKKHQKYDKEKALSRDGSHKCLEYCRKCGSSFGNSYVCAEDVVGYHKPPFTFMLFSNKCQMKCYNKCHNTNYRYSTNSLCQKVMAVLEKDGSSTQHPLRHERHHVWVNSEKMSDAKQ